MIRRFVLSCGAATSVALLLSCGGGSTGTDKDSGVNKTYLSVDATDADGDTLHYQWRVTGGTVDNRDARETVWTMPDGPGLHFAYVTVSDGKGGWVEQQYAVSSDRLDVKALVPAPIDRAAPSFIGTDGTQVRLRFRAPGQLMFADGAGAEAERMVFMPDVQVRLVPTAGGAPVYSGKTDARGEVDLPKLAPDVEYRIECALQVGSAFADCVGETFTPGPTAKVIYVSPQQTTARNLRLHGHVALADGTGCGRESEFFSIHTSATVRLTNADGSAASDPVRVNRFGDYAIDASVPVRAALQLEIQCEGYAATVGVRAANSAAGYVDTDPIELSHVVANARPRIVKMVASGADGNVRGRMIEPGSGTGSNTLPGSDHFLTYKGRDTKLSACLYYQGLGANAGCDALGNMQAPITLADWIRKNSFGTPSDVSATYVNKRDLNLVRRMVGTQTADRIAFYVCNSPGPDGSTQTEIDDTIATGLGDDNRVACVAMEYSSVPGVNGDRPFTQFYTFGPTGSLLLSINLDGRGEKYMPGSCIACHGGSTYNGRFPEQDPVSPYVGARFLPFDTGNYLFSSKSAYTEASQSESIYRLNALVVGTEGNPASCTTDRSTCTPTTRLIAGWYAAGHVLDKAYVPPQWQAAAAVQPDADDFYREVVGTSCRTCHVALGANFDWDSIILSPTPIAGISPRRDPSLQACGGQADLALNASMPNALIASDLLLNRARDDSALASLMRTYLGCSAPAPDPVYPKR
ncbi:MAG: hypothetical protein ABIM89_05730 [Mycobacteriales bacterium]